MRMCACSGAVKCKMKITYRVASYAKNASLNINANPVHCASYIHARGIIRAVIRKTRFIRLNAKRSVKCRILEVVFLHRILREGDTARQRVGTDRFINKLDGSQRDRLTWWYSAFDSRLLQI